MKITKSKLEKMNACASAVEAFQAQKERDVCALFDLMLENHTEKWANWLMVRLLNKKNRILYAIHAAEKCLVNFEMKFPDDTRPRRAIAAAKKYLKSPARSAARSARSAARSAWSAAWSAERSAYKNNIKYGIGLLKRQADRRKP